MLKRRMRAIRARPLVLLCDVSGSMEGYSRMLLHFAHAVTKRHRRVEAFLFSTKLTPRGRLSFDRRNMQSDAKYFDFHEDMSPRDVAAFLHGQVVWQQSQHGEWAAVLRFPRIVNAAERLH